MPRYADRVKETTATTGTGTITFSGASTGFQTFASGFPSGIRPCSIGYAIEDGSAWEVGRGTLNSSGTTLTRDIIRASSTGSVLSLSGSAVVFCTPAAEMIDNANIGQVMAQATGQAMP